MLPFFIDDYWKHNHESKSYITTKMNVNEIFIAITNSNLAQQHLGELKKNPQKITDTTGVMASSVSVKKRVVYISVLWGCVGYLNKSNGYLNQ